jgi:transposase-like protein
MLRIFAERWAGRYPATVSLWLTSWAERVPFLDILAGPAKHSVRI